MNFDHFPADRLRAVPLETVLTLCGARRDRHDRAKWHTERGPLSVTGAKFFNWHQHQGGGGAIDLVMHLAGVDYRTARRWLEANASAALPAASLPAAAPAGGKPATARRLACLAAAPARSSPAGPPFRPKAPSGWPSNSPSVPGAAATAFGWATTYSSTTQPAPTVLRNTAFSGRTATTTCKSSP
jgi:hypothetical protein